MKISVVLTVRNEAKFIQDLLETLSGQSYKDFEIIMVDNGSTDGTGEIIRAFSDGRLKYFYEPSLCGIAAARNLGIKEASGEYIFFTDGDCLPTKHWLKEGLEILETGEYAAVSGKTFYESETEVTVSDCNTHQFVDGQYMACNIAYRRDILEKVNYFDPVFKYSHEDADLAFRVLKLGKICFAPQMLVGHQKKRLTVSGLLNRAKRAANEVDY